MNNFIDYAFLLTRRKQEAGKTKTAANYNSAIRAIARFLSYEGRTEVLPFSDVTPELIERFEAYLLGQCGIKRNTSSFYMRNLQAIWNEAIRAEMALPGVMPFSKVYTGVDRTRHRATHDENIKCLITAQLDKRPALAFARDIFLFSFFGHGIAFVDIAKLRKKDLSQGHLSYVRSKTGKPLYVNVLPIMDEIVQRWSNPESPYLLPIVALPFCARKYNSALRRYNRNLRRLSDLLHFDCHLTSYIARHSWASEAYRLQVPVSVISSCMGHTTENTTRIYLRSLDTQYIDQQVSVIEQYYTQRINDAE